MYNSSRLLAEIDRKRSRSNSGWHGLSASSSTRSLKASHDSSRLIKRFSEVASISLGRAAALCVTTLSPLAARRGLGVANELTLPGGWVTVITSPLRPDPVAPMNRPTHGASARTFPALLCRRPAPEVLERRVQACHDRVLLRSTLQQTTLHRCSARRCTGGTRCHRR